MSENNSQKGFLKFREILSESSLRDVILFAILYLFILAQSWSNIFLLLFPIITFGFSLFFRTINSNKYRIFLENNIIIYNPLGMEKKHANRLNFTSLVQLILLFWIGAESFYHPQLIQTYDLFFNLCYPLFFTFGFYWILTDIWKYSKITIGLNGNNSEKLLSSLNVQKFKLLSIANLGSFILINLLNIIFTLFLENSNLFGFSYFLPGTGVENSLPLKISITYFFIIWLSPLLACLLLFLIYKDINNINQRDFANYISKLPEKSRNLLIQNLRDINKKFFRDLKNE